MTQGLSIHLWRWNYHFIMDKEVALVILVLSATTIQCLEEIEPQSQVVSQLMY